jgi:hypothetical protein
MATRGRINLNNLERDLETQEIKLRIKYLLEHEEIKEDYPREYDLILSRLQKSLNYRETLK